MKTLTEHSFIFEVVQRGRIRPSMYTHEIGMPLEIYESMSTAGVIDHEYYFIAKSAFFEFKKNEVVISFQHLFAAEDFHHLIDRFLIKRLTGKYPIRRRGVSKMNFDDSVM